MLKNISKLLVLLAVIQGSSANSTQINKINELSNESIKETKINNNEIKNNNNNIITTLLGNNLVRKSKILDNQKMSYRATKILSHILKKSESSTDLERNFSNLESKYQTLIVNYLGKLNKNKNITQKEIFEIFETDKNHMNTKKIIKNNKIYLKKINKTNSEIEDLKKNIKDYIPNIIKENKNLKHDLKSIEASLKYNGKKLVKYETKLNCQTYEEELQNGTINFVGDDNSSNSSNSQNHKSDQDYPSSSEKSVEDSDSDDSQNSSIDQDYSSSSEKSVEDSDSSNSQNSSINQDYHSPSEEESSYTENLGEDINEIIKKYKKEIRSLEKQKSNLKAQISKIERVLEAYYKK